MRLQMAFSTDGPWESGRGTLQLPMEIALDPYGKFRVEESQLMGEAFPGSDPACSLLVIVAEKSVDPERLTLKADPIFQERDESGTDRPYMALASPEIGELAEGAGLVFSAIGFAIGIALPFGPHLSPEFPTRYLPDCREDRDLLKKLGDFPRTPLTGRTGIEVFKSTDVDADFVQELARRRTLRIYPEALHDINPTATFRDLWRTLELAFQAEGSKLTGLLAEFGPVKRLGFDREELEELRAIRGQISHASSRLGPLDVSRFETAASEFLGRLWSLVDWVILSKKDASQSLEEDELRPLAAFIRRDGSTQVEPWVNNPEEWQITNGWGASPRFHAPE